MQSKSKDIAANVRNELPELEDIQDKDLRDKVVAAWSMSLSQEGLSRISNMEGCGSPGRLQLRSGTQLTHIRAVTNMARASGEALKASAPDLPLDLDVLIAGGLLHDVGKPFEFNPDKRMAWTERPSACGFPSMRHPAHGWHICLMAGLPIEVAHIAGAHSHEGEHVQRSLECTLVHHADFCYWRALKVSGLLLDPALS
ncbi:HD domain-containing protein [Mameliella sediminis]|uniref:HD domain-containing protein n=1 Tax=Mameliella sediminis TaxID=2836866 RepID=UPI001C452F41|nr:HD domain-containing protein [Mameliella sediminis]MBV7396880.1 HD domain-containing protein [Mameliella sediminis]MBY6116162.1 HD domain-containing protein [Antarctobacter heliothermus]MBY6146127.1 HD domain-containing protein [Mameliella alba]MCA0955312.1 HD domain-containing protein [Mameliella alba]